MIGPKKSGGKNASINNNNQDCPGDLAMKTNLPANVETWVQSLIWGVPTCHGATKLLHPRACVQQQKKPLQRKAHIPQLDKALAWQ